MIPQADISMSQGKSESNYPLARERRMYFWLVKLLDALLSILILAPLVVAYWRGTFLLLEIYLIPKHRFVSIGMSLVIAFVGGVLFIYIQDVLKDFVHNVRSPLSELMLKRVYCYIFGLIVVNHWRGVWALWDDFTGTGLDSGVYCFTAGMVVLLLTRCFRNGISPPMVAASDLHDDFFAIQTRFRTPHSKPILLFLDCIFSVTIPGSAIVFVCRGFWYILDYYFLFPHKAYSALLSCALGGFLVFLALLLQRPAAFVSRRLEDGHHWFLKICFEDLFMFLATIAGINIWRGVWGLCDELVFPNDFVLSSWTCHVIGMGGLMLMFHGSSALLKGFQIDGEFLQGQGCYLPASSFTIFEHHMGQTHRVPAVPVTAASDAPPSTEEGENLLKMIITEHNRTRAGSHLTRHSFDIGDPRLSSWNVDN